MPLYRGHVEISSGSLFIGHTEIENGYQAISQFYENDPNVTVTLNVIDNITGGNQYTIGGDLTGATSTGLPGQSYAFNTTVTPTSGYYFTSGPTINNASGTYSTSQTVNTTLAGIVAVIPPNQCVGTAVVQNSVTNGAGNLSFTTTPTSVSRVCPNTLQGSSDFSTTATITNSNYDWSSGPSFSYPINTISSSQNVTIVATGALALKQGTVSLTVTDSVATTGGAAYTLTCNGTNVAGGLNSPVQLSGGYGTAWSYAMAVASDPVAPGGTYEYQFTSGPAYNWNSGGASSTATLSGTYSVPTLNQAVVVTGTCAATSGRTKCDVVNNISAPAGSVSYQVQYKIGAGGSWVNYTPNTYISSNASPVEQYIWQVVITLSAGYTWTSTGAASFNPGSTTTIEYGTDKDTIATLTGTAIANLSSFSSSSTSRATCSVACADSIAATYYHDDSSGMASATPQVGDYVFTNSTGTSPLANGWYRSGVSNFSKYAYHVAGNGGLVDDLRGPGSTCNSCNP